jgi:hypothetical protein
MYEKADTRRALRYRSPRLEPGLPGSAGFPELLNEAHFSDPTWDRRLQAAARLSGPAGYRTYGKLDVELARDEAPAASLEVSTSGQFFSARIGCEINQPAYDTVDLAALCLRR